MATQNPIQDYYTTFNRYPGNNKQWWVAKASVDNPDKGIKAGDFLPELMDKLFTGNTRAPQGHFIVSAFNVDRSAVSGIPGLPVEATNERPSSVAFFSGRVWYAADSTVYYSQIMDEKKKAGMCYQEADPTSEDISDLVESDGGAIPIPEASKIIKLVSTGNGMLVFAFNGVWYISGGANGFSAVDISVSKISSVGTKYPLSIVQTQDTVFWWSDIGIQALKQASGQFGPIEGKFDNQNITETTIQTLYNDIPEQAKLMVKGCYDPAANTIQWLYQDGEILETQFYNRVLLLDLTLGAFYTWKTSSEDLVSGPFLTGLFLSTSYNNIQINNEVVSEGAFVTASGLRVISEDFVTDIKPSAITYTAVSRVGGNSMFLAATADPLYSDWRFINDTGLAYESFVQTGYQLLDDAMRDKQMTYVFTYLRKTEESYVPDPDNPGGYILANPSSCLMQVKWDWSNSSSSGRWTTPVEVYRFTRPTFVPNDLTFDYGTDVIITKNKVRGHGKSIQFKFSCDRIGYNFDLLGWAVPYTGNTEV